MKLSYRQADYDDYLTQEDKSQKRLVLPVDTWSDGEDWGWDMHSKPMVVDPREPIYDFGYFNGDFDGKDKVSLTDLKLKINDIFEKAGWTIGYGNFMVKKMDYNDPLKTLRDIAPDFGVGVEVKGDRVNASLSIPFYDFIKNNFGVDL